MNGSQKYNFDQLRNQINDELLDKDMPKKLYKSTNGIFRIIDAIISTNAVHGDNWTAHVVDEEDKPLLTESEQHTFKEAFEPYLESIIDFFGGKQQGGDGLNEISKELLSLHPDAQQQDEQDPTKMFGVDDIYAKLINKIGQIDNIVNSFASKYGVLKLEKEHDLEPDPLIIPKPLIVAIEAALTLVAPEISGKTADILKQVRVPFRFLIFALYLALDVARIAMGVTNQAMGRKILSIVLAIAEFLRGDWKKAILTFVGYYGMTPLLFGEIIKVYLSLFRSLSPQLQQDLIFGSLDASKSLLIGTLLSIFQVTAPAEIRLPLIKSLEDIARIKAEMDGKLVEAGLSARPDYFSPTFQDLNNIQAVMSDDAIICSCEFENLVKAVDKSPIIRIILQILRVPVTEEFRNWKCGNKPCTDFVHGIVKQSINKQENQEALTHPLETELPISIPLSQRQTRGGIRSGRVLHSRKRH